MIPHQIDLAGFSFAATGHGHELYVLELKGWYELPDVRGKVEAIPNAHGSYNRAQVYRESKAITLTALQTSTDRPAVERLRQELTSKLHEPTQIAVTDETGTWLSDVIIESVEFQEWNAREPAFRLVIDMLAPDPIRYQPVTVTETVTLPERSGGLTLPAALGWNLGTDIRSRATLENWGTTPLYPKLVVEGRARSITVAVGRSQLSFPAFDGVLVFDCRERRAILNGVDVTRSLIKRDWPVVDPDRTVYLDFWAIEPNPEISMHAEYKIGAW